MPYTLDDLVQDIKEILILKKCQMAQIKFVILFQKPYGSNFITDNLPDRANGELPRQILYEDKELVFVFVVMSMIMKR